MPTTSKIQSVADLFSEEEDRLTAEANTPERIAADEAKLARDRARWLAEDIAAGRRDAAGNWVDGPDDADGEDEGDEDEDADGDDAEEWGDL